MINKGIKSWLKNVTFNETCFQGHFPENPIYPGVLILESMAQTTACMFTSTESKKASEGKMFYFAGIDNARFKKQVIPGDIMFIHSELIKLSRGVYKTHSQVTVDEKVVCQADIMVALR